MISAVIFDMDGLLIDSEPYWRASHIAALAKHGRTITENDVRQMAGKRTDEVVQHWRDTRNLQHVPNEQLETEIVESVIVSVKRHGKELPGVVHVLELLKAHDMPMAVASSSSQPIIDAVLAKLQLADYFTFSYSAKNEEFGKPHPGVFLTTARKLAVEPHNCLVFEDAISGVTAALAAGMHCIAVPEAVNFEKPSYDKAGLKVHSLADVDWKMIQSITA